MLHHETLARFLRYLAGVLLGVAIFLIAALIGALVMYWTAPAHAEPLSTWRNSALVKLHIGDISVLARTLYGEARGEKLEGMQAVAWVILNRAKRGPPRFPDTITGVCKQDKQFSCWNKGDPNAKLCAQVHEGDPYYALALYAAAGVLTGSVPDPTRGSDHYHTVGMTPYPSWSRSMQLQAVIGQHRFYIDQPKGG
jgi:N-acetylmuramoyl-L-alanine amidase